MRMVIRSTLGELPNAYVQLGRIANLEGHTTPASSTSTRTNATSRRRSDRSSSRSGTEVRRRDRRVDRIGDLNAQFDIAAAESGSFLQAGPNVFVVNPPDPDHATELTDRPHEGGHPRSRANTCATTSTSSDLPVPARPVVGRARRSRRCRVHRVRGCSSGNRTAANAPWYDRRPLRVRIENGAGPPVYDANARLLTVLLPQAEMVTVNLSSYLDRRHAGAVRSVDDPARHLPQLPHRRPRPEKGATGCSRRGPRCTLVHAVEKPLAATGDRGAGRRRAEHRRAPLRRRDVRGARRRRAEPCQEHAVGSTWRRMWTEPIDDVLQDTPTTLDGQRHVGDFQLDASEDACRIDRDDAPASGTQPPKHGSATNSRTPSTGTSRTRRPRRTRFREYFPPAITNDRTLITHVGPEVAAERSVVAPSGSAARAVRRADVDVHGTDRPRPHRRREPGATSRVDVRCAPAPAAVCVCTWTARGDRRVSTSCSASCSRTSPGSPGRSTSRPGMQVSAVAKAHGRGIRGAGDRRAAREAGGQGDAQRRASGCSQDRAASVRVECARRAPRAESLAAAAAIFPRCRADDGAATQTTEPRAPRRPDRFVLPPERRSAEVRHPLGPRPDLGLRRTCSPARTSISSRCGPRSATASRCSKLPDIRRPSWATTPEFDQVRKLWYCDLQLDAGTSYFPFVKLALARYQPHSIPRSTPLQGRVPRLHATRGRTHGRDHQDRPQRRRDLVARPGRLHLAAVDLASDADDRGCNFRASSSPRSNVCPRMHAAIWRGPVR